jgi:GDP-mannose 6-dehydrogenase
LGLKQPIVNAVLVSNQNQISRALGMVMGKGNLNVGVLGLSFKAGTDDLRESPLVELVERLVQEGYNLRVYDPNIHMKDLVGANREYIFRNIPDISDLVAHNLEDVLAHADTLVVGNKCPEFEGVLKTKRPGTYVVDLVRIDASYGGHANYEGICW